MRMCRLLLAGWLAGVVAGCATPTRWQELAVAELPTNGGPRLAAVYVELPGRELSDRMVAEALPAAEVHAALAAGGWRSYRIDGFAAAAQYAEWIGSGEGMGVVVFDATGQVLGTRPGPQDAEELAAYLRLAARRRDEVAAARLELAAHRGPDELLRLGQLLLELGARRETAACLAAAAAAGARPAQHLLARLYALEGRLELARATLPVDADEPGAWVTEGYLLYKERRHPEAVLVLARALAGELGDERPRARLFYGKALHEAGRDAEAEVVLVELVRDSAGTTFAGAALHTLMHMRNPDHGHTH